MHIALDLRWIRSEHIDGTSRYALDFVSHLLQYPTTHRYLLLGDAALIERFIPSARQAQQAEVRTIPERLLSLRDFWHTPRSLQALGIDIYHSPSYLCSPFTGGYAKILTVFDLIPFLFPEALSKSRLFWKLFYATRYPATAILRSADVIVTASEHTKQDIVRLLKIPADHIRVIGIGLDACFHPNIQVPDDFWQRHQLPRKFLLYVGRQDPYKGLSYLVQAFAALPPHLRDGYALVIAGKTDSRYIGTVQQLVAQLGLNERVHFFEYVPERELPVLYTAASLLVQPSLYEGFGLPPLEAMACGTPVVYAASSSLSEVVGEAGYAVPSASTNALTDGIRNMLENTTVRENFSQRGLQHVRRYSWESIIPKILTMYAQM